MGQLLNKPKKGGEGAKGQTPVVDSKALAEVLDDQTLKAITAATSSLEDFYHEFYLIIQKLNEKAGATQFKLRDKKDLENKFKNYFQKDKPITKEQLKNIMEQVVSFEDLSIGSRTIEAIMFLFGIPIVALLAKRLIPATRSISDDIVIPIATSSTVVLLTTTRKL